MDIRLALMSGVDIPIPELQAVLHQPSIKEISFVGEKDFLTGVQCLSLEKTMLIQDENLLSQTTNFQIFMTVMSEKQTQDKKECVILALNLLFPGSQIFMTPRAISINCDGRNITIDEGNFEIFQQVISQVFYLNKTPN